MGTSYSITIADRLRPSELRAIKEAVEARLAEIDAQMSTWNPDSEISMFNRSNNLEPFAVSPEFYAVVRRAREMAMRTYGAFDPTVKPLVDHWGFGAEADPEPVEKLMEAVGWQKFRVEKNRLLKEYSNVQLDLSAIAKGYGVDAISDVIAAFGFVDFLVEIGGEIRVVGLNPDGWAWRIGIQDPGPEGGVFRAVSLTGMAMATSGDYRNFRLAEDGTRYSHIIDPRTGLPAETDVASVSVVAPACMDADAASTALFVMGSEKGMEWLSFNPNFEAFFILHSSNQTFTVIATPGFPADE